jgi:5-methylcytosine-specific restriction endonuclease McrA
VHEWRLRTDMGYLREQVFARRIRRLPPKLRRQALLGWGITRRTRRSLWDADHIVAVSEGGGECDLANLRTLCLKCHQRATAELRARKLAKRLSSGC